MEDFHVLHEIFEAQADARPDAVAVMFDREETTYADLEARATFVRGECNADRSSPCSSHGLWTPMRLSSAF